MGLLDDAIREHLDLKRQRGADPGEIERLEREALGPVRREPTARSVVGDVPHLEVEPDAEHHTDPPTELHRDDEPNHEPRRGFLRRHRSPPMPRPGPSDFAEPADAGLKREHAEQQDDPLGHPDPFGQDQFDGDVPFPDDAPVAAAAHEVGPEPPHVNLDSAPPRRPSFAPVPPSASETHEEPAPDDHAAADAHARPDAAGETREWSVEEAFASHDGASPPPEATPVEEDVLEETPEFLQDTPDHDRLWFEQRPPRDFDFDG